MLEIFLSLKLTLLDATHSSFQSLSVYKKRFQCFPPIPNIFCHLAAIDHTQAFNNEISLSAFLVGWYSTTWWDITAEKLPYPCVCCFYTALQWGKFCACLRSVHWFLRQTILNSYPELPFTCSNLQGYQQTFDDLKSFSFKLGLPFVSLPHRWFSGRFWLKISLELVI